MVDKVNGSVKPGESVSGDWDWFTVRTTMDITATGALADASQRRLNKLVEVISLRAQPVILGGVSVAEETAPIADLPVSGSSGTVDVYTIKFAIEHAGAIDEVLMGETLNGVEGFVYTTPTTGNNVSIVRNTLL